MDKNSDVEKNWRRRCNQAYSKAAADIMRNMVANNKDLQHTASKFGELIDGINKALNIENGVFIIFLYMVVNHWQESIDNISVEKILDFYKAVERIKINMQFRNEDYDPILHDRFKALSVKQPYAGYIASGEKQIEVRSKPTKYRGELLICASRDGKPSESAPGYGCTLAFVELYDCKPLSELTPEEWEKTKLPGYIVEKLKASKNGYGWFLRNPRRVIEFPVKGQLGIFNLVFTKDLIFPYPTHLTRPVTD